MDDQEQGYTAVVYFHGMGEQRRYEEVSRLVDALDNYNYWAKQTADQQKGMLYKIRARFECGRAGLEKDISYIRVYHKVLTDNNRIPVLRPFRFYEAYWAPITAEGQKALSVLKWMLRQIVTPFKTLSSPWRHRQRLRRAALHCVWDDYRRKKYPTVVRPQDFVKLAALYNNFERIDVIRKFKKGNFSQFLNFITQKYAKNNDTRMRLITLARHWRRHYLIQEIRNAAVLITLTLAIGLGAGALLLFLLAIFQNISDTFPVPEGDMQFTLSYMIAKASAYGQQHIIGIGLTLLGVLGVGRFLQKYMGDVLLWTTYEETNTNYQKRRAILDHGFQVLKHVLSDNDCQRVVIVAHSLGTAVAMDSMLELARHNRARNPEAPMNGPLKLEKIDQFITLGSPIDKIHYFFESFTEKYHRYLRVVDDVRGDIGTPPFSKNRKQHIHWINYWDRADVVSGALHSASNSRWSYPRIDNVEVNSYWFPDPGKSHHAYFEHRDVIGDLFEILFTDAHSFRNGVMRSIDSTEEQEMFIGPGTRSMHTTFFHILALAVPWILLIGLTTQLTSTINEATPYYYLSGGIFAILLFSGVVNTFLGHRKGFRPNGK